MKTPMQEHIEWLKKEKDSHGYEKHPYFECAIEHAESMLEKEKETMVDFAYKCRDIMAADHFAITLWYDRTFNTKER